MITNNLRFQGQYYDQETELYYNRYRYYLPYVGRFISKDPIRLLGGNTFAYAPNPVGWIDPYGLTCTFDTKSNRWRNNETGKYKTRPVDPSETVYNKI
ncbi:hypothetical protein C9E89_022285 [Acinetobacter sichuanensis]|uniref:RHS repeat-associated core domain-containing protein n=1 Tax=Acinetobacter sichuanensis TaxID=2136183 RepID=A0A371YIR4_9GAMM|nr:hypothetical protein C9E89_022285 [Acinetobacter sichuanensis]